jgi:hypothetical protein
MLPLEVRVSRAEVLKGPDAKTEGAAVGVDYDLGRLTLS